MRRHNLGRRTVSIHEPGSVRNLAALGCSAARGPEHLNLLFDSVFS